MSKKYNIFIYNVVNFPEVEANSAGEAKKIALEWWIQCIPTIACFKSEKEE